MSLRTYFDAALKKGETVEKRQQALGTTVKKGDAAKRHMQHARESLEKIQAKQGQKRKAFA